MTKKPLPKTVDGIARRDRLDKYSPAEQAIRDALLRVEELGADVRLTDAINLLHQAQEKVADYLED